MKTLLIGFALLFILQHALFHASGMSKQEEQLQKQEVGFTDTYH